MSISDHISVDDIEKIPPMIFGTIRWKANIGGPVGDYCQGFDVLVEERTPTQFRVGPSGIEPVPGSSHWKVIPDAVTCYTNADVNGVHAISFRAWGLHLNFPPDGTYRVTPTLKGGWRPSGIFSRGYRVIDPIKYYVTLRPSSRFQHIEFEVLQRSWFGGWLLS
jgi:hypothetical protein